MSHIGDLTVCETVLAPNLGKISMNFLLTIQKASDIEVIINKKRNLQRKR